MKTITWIVLLALPLVNLSLGGCTRPSTVQKPEPVSSPPGDAGNPATDKAAVEANLAKLTPEDRRFAEEQGFCPVETKNRLGTMGVPYKTMIQGQPVFLCCDGCETRARAHADRTLARVKQLKEKRTGG